MKELSATEREIALMVVVDLWNPGRRVAKIASHFNLKPIAVECLLNRPEFKEEVAGTPKTKKEKTEKEPKLSPAYRAAGAI